jgi:hypothetical protein
MRQWKFSLKNNLNLEKKIIYLEIIYLEDIYKYIYKYLNILEYIYYIFRILR